MKFDPKTNLLDLKVAQKADHIQSFIKSQQAYFQKQSSMDFIQKSN